MPIKKKKTVRKTARKTKAKRSSGLNGFQKFVRTKTKGVSKRVKALEMALKKAKRVKAVAVKKATTAYRKKAK
jgi:transposase